MADDTINVKITSTFEATGAAAAKVAVGQIGDAATKADRQLLSYARTVASAQKAQGDNAGAAATLSNALGRVDTSSKEAQATIGQLARTTQQSGASFRGLAQAAAAFGLVSIGPQMVKQALDFGVAEGQAALKLRETKNSLAAIAGDQRTYNQILSEAKAQQVAFGGSLQDNIEGIQGLAVSARASGADLSQLIDLQKRLTVLDPAQGAAGARLALNEALSGNVSSLSRRFEIPKEQLKQLSDTSLPVAERLKAIDAFLNKVGITSASVASKVDQDAAAFRGLSQQLETAGINAGNKLASGLAGAAEGLSRLIGVVNSDPEAIAKLGSLLSGQPIQGGPGGTIDRIRAIQAQDQANSTLNNGIGGAVASGKLGDQKQQAQELLTLLNFAGERSAAAGAQATNAFIQSSQGADQYIATLKRLVVESQSQQAQQQQLNDALAEDIKKKIDGQIAAKALADRQKELAADSLLAAKGLLGSGDQALILANKYGIAANQAQFLIDQQAKIAGQGAKVSTAARALPNTTQAAGLLALAQGRQTTAGDINASQDRYNRLKLSELQIAYAGAKTDAQKIAILNQELKYTDDQVGKNGILAQIEGLKASGAKAHTSELDKQLNLQERTYDSINKQIDAQLALNEAIVKSRQDERNENEKLKTANRVIAALGGRSDARSQDLVARARDDIELIGIEREKRARQQAELAATAGATIRNGKLYQSLPGGGAPPVLPASGGGAGAPVSAPAVAAPSAGGGVTVVNQLVIDGKVAAEAISPYLWDQLMRAGQSVAAQRGI